MRTILESLYRSPFGKIMSGFANLVANMQKPFMVYGYYDYKSGIFRKFTRMSSNVTIMNKRNLEIGDHVWVWHYSILDATEGISIGEGAQIGAWVGIFTHGSESSIRLLGNQFVHIPNTKRLGYTRGSVKIGDYTFIGAGSVVLPGVTIGKGCLVGTGSLINKNVEDYSIVVGAPAKVVGSTIEYDEKFFYAHDLSDTYYDKDALNQIQIKMGLKNEASQ